MNQEDIQAECNKLVRIMENRGYTGCIANCEFIANQQIRFYLSTKEKMFPNKDSYHFIHADTCEEGFAKALSAVMALPTDEERRALDLAQKMAAAREAAIAHGASNEIIAMFEKLNEELWKNALPAPQPVIGLDDEIPF